MSRRNRGALEEVLDDLVELPWWVGIGVAAFSYSFLSLISPAVAPLALIFLLPAAISALRQSHRSGLLDRQANLESIRRLSWQDFEKLVGEAFHRQGYGVEEKGGANADGGIDIALRRGNERVIVQCKHWRTRVVGVAPVRELYGVMTAERATRAVLVTSGSFSADAHGFASGKPLQLIDGPSLEKLVAAVGNGATSSARFDSGDSALSCPECGGKMVKRTAKRGIRAGNTFWGCSRFPVCRGIRQTA